MKDLSKMTETWDVPSSSLARKTFNPIRNILETMDLKPNPQKKMISLSIGDPTVFGNLKPSENIIEAVKESLESGNYNGYASSTGYPEARAAVAKHVAIPGSMDLTEEDVVLCSGCSCALDLAISVLAEPGDNILIPRPGFSLYQTLALGMGIDVKEYDLVAEREWEADLAHLESQIDGRTRAIVVNNPSNPCGSVFSEQHLMDILAVAERYRVPIIADEIYDHFVFSGRAYIPIASLTKTVPVLSCGGLTKRFLVPGWRLGWITIHDRNDSFSVKGGVRDGLKSLSQRIIGANTLVQGALPAILKETPQSFFDETISTIEANARVAFDKLSAVPGLKPVMPSGAMYMMVGLDRGLFPAFPGDLELVEAMVREQSVFCLPGQCFNVKDYFRIVLTIPEKSLSEACDRINDFCLIHASQTSNQRRIWNQLSVIDESDSTKDVNAEDNADTSSAYSSSSGANSSDEDPNSPVLAKKTPAAGEVAARRRFVKPPPLIRRETVTRLA